MYEGHHVDATDMIAESDKVWARVATRGGHSGEWEGVIEVPVAFLPGQGDTVIRIRDAAGERNETIVGIDEYQLMVEHFAACVRGQATLRYSPTEAAANMRVIEALYRSARNGGRPETIDKMTR